MGQANRLDRTRRNSTSDCVVLDGDYLLRNTFGDKALRQEIIGLFGAQVESSLVALSNPLSKDGWHYLTHTLRGAAAAVGAQAIVGLAEKWGDGSIPASLIEKQTMQAVLRQELAAFRVAVDKL
jgi:HPt (histidine-containing phosphotransfer) domain-containing protein